MNPVPVWLADFGDATVWSATISVVVFVLQYTFSSPWWHDPVGRAVVAKDIALLLLLIPSVILMVWPTLLTPLEAECLGVASLFLVTASVVWRCVVWWKIKPPRLRRSKPISTEDSSPLAKEGRCGRNQPGSSVLRGLLAEPRRDPVRHDRG